MATKIKNKKGYVLLSDGREMKVNRMSTRQFIFRRKWLYIMLVPGILYFVLFRYVPMFGLVIAFENYSPFKGILESDFVGLEQFRKFLTAPDFLRLLRNTLGISLLQLVLYFPAPIIFSLFLNEVRHSGYKRLI